jgi:hypothetical protein
LLQVLGSLEGLAELPVWRSAEAAASAGGSLPAFSAYPQQAVTAAGEYLMMLPQTLEGLLGGDGEAEEAAVDAEWLDKAGFTLLIASLHALQRFIPSSLLIPRVSWWERMFLDCREGVTDSLVACFDSCI